MNSLVTGLAVAVAVMSWTQAAHAEHDDNQCKASCGGGVQLTTLPPGDAHCPTGGVMISTPSCPARGDADGHDRVGDRKDGVGKSTRTAIKGAERRHGEDDRGDGDRAPPPPPPPQIAFVCNGAANTGGGGGDAYTTSNSGVDVPARAPAPTPVATLVLPAGNYVVSAKAQLSHAGEGGAGEIDCTVTAQTAAIDVDRQRVTVQGFATTALLGGFSTATGDTLTLQCSTPETFAGRVANAELVAHKVSTLFSDGVPTPTAAVKH